MDSVKPYTYFSKIYSHLMQDVDYKFWGKYIIDIHKTIGKKTDIALELAGGNCSLAKYLIDVFSKLIITDISKEMLSNCHGKFSPICCEMTALPFNCKFDFIFSAFDSVNYLSSDEKLSLFFETISRSLSPNGYFVFDVSLKSNSLKHLKKLNRTGKYRGINYEQKSEFNHKTNIHTNQITIQLKNGKTYFEIHKQKIYDFYYYFDVIDSKGLYVVECFDAFSFNDATPESDRVQFILKRKN